MAQIWTMMRRKKVPSTISHRPTPRRIKIGNAKPLLPQYFVHRHQRPRHIPQAWTNPEMDHAVLLLGIMLTIVVAIWTLTAALAGTDNNHTSHVHLRHNPPKINQPPHKVPPLLPRTTLEALPRHLIVAVAGSTTTPPIGRQSSSSTATDLIVANTTSTVRLETVPQLDTPSRAHAIEIVAGRTTLRPLEVGILVGETRGEVGTGTGTGTGVVATGAGIERWIDAQTEPIAIIGAITPVTETSIVIECTIGTAETGSCLHQRPVCNSPMQDGRPLRHLSSWQPT